MRVRDSSHASALHSNGVWPLGSTIHLHLSQTLDFGSIYLELSTMVEVLAKRLAKMVANSRSVE